MAEVSGIVLQFSTAAPIVANRERREG